MIHGVDAGNAKTDAPSRARNGWFVGHFMDANSLRNSADVEVKWGIHVAGERNRGGFVANTGAKSLSILISGRFRLHFRDRADRESVHTLELIDSGDYAMWERGIEHDWEAMTDCTILTVRWPSVRPDQDA